MEDDDDDDDNDGEVGLKGKVMGSKSQVSGG